MDKAVAVDSEKQALEHKNVDAALEFLASEEIRIMTEVDEKKLVRKIDWRIMPVMCTSTRRLPSRCRCCCCLTLLIMNTQGLVITFNTSTRHSSTMPT